MPAHRHDTVAVVNVTGRRAQDSVASVRQNSIYHSGNRGSSRGRPVWREGLIAGPFRLTRRTEPRTEKLTGRKAWIQLATLRNLPVSLSAAKCHLTSQGLSTSASAAVAWGNQNVISMARYNMIAVASSDRACSRRPVSR